MDLQLAGIIAHDTRERAVQDARTDLHRLQQQAIEAGRDESRRLIKVSEINRITGQATYRPAGRLLRDWYLHCYLNALRGRLGAPAVTIDAQQIEDTTALLHRLTPNQASLAALRAVAMLRDVADADAARATVGIATSLHATAAHRAIAHAPDSRFDADRLRIHVTRHWYLHCYLDQVQTTTRSWQPYPVTDTVEHHVALALTSRTIYPLLSDAATALTARGGHRPDRERTTTDRTAADDPRLPFTEGPPEEAARIMFHHPNQLLAPVRYETAETDADSNRLPRLNESATESESVGRPLPPRIA